MWNESGVNNTSIIAYGFIVKTVELSTIYAKQKVIKLKREKNKRAMERKIETIIRQIY